MPGLCRVQKETLALPTVAPQGPQLCTPHRSHLLAPQTRGHSRLLWGWGLNWVSLSQMPSLPLPSPRLQPRWQPLAFCSSWHCLQGPGPGWGLPIGHVCTAAARPGPQLPPAHTPLRLSGRSGCSCPMCGPPSTSQSSKVSVTERWPHPGPCPHRDTTLRDRGMKRKDRALRP